MISLTVCDIDRYESFIKGQSNDASSSPSGFNVKDNSRIRNMSFEKMQIFLQSCITLEIEENSRVARLGKLLWADEIVIKTGTDYLITQKNGNQNKRRFKCHQSTSEYLKLERQLSSYGIEDGFLILVETNMLNTLHSSRNPNLYNGYSKSNVVACLAPVRYTDFLDHIESKIDGYGIDTRSCKHCGIILYTDEDIDLSSYLRTNFHSLDGLTSDDLHLAVIEEPHTLNGIASNQYWKSKLNSKLYSLLSFIGYTNHKPYDKAKIYDLVRKCNIEVSDLPCIMIYHYLAKDEKLLIKITGEIVDFFRNLISTIKKVEGIIKNDIEIEKANIRPTVKLIKTTPITAPVHSKEWEHQLEIRSEEIKKQRVEGAVGPGELNSAVEKIYQSKNLQLETFNYFRSRFLENWHFEANGNNLAYEFRGNTVFVNNPSGTLIIKDLFNQNYEH